MSTDSTHRGLGGLVSDPFGFFSLLAVGLLALVIGVIGLRRGRAVALVEPLRFTRTQQPIRFWYAISVQMIIAAMCLVVAAVKAID